MSAPPLVSVVIVTWNGRHLLEQCLPSVVATRYAALEIIVVDNGSTDGTVGWLRAHHPTVRVLALDENRGFCGGNNAGMEIAEGDYVVLLNNDVEVTPDWLGPLVVWMERHPSCGAAQPKLLRHDRRDAFEYAGACGGFLDALGYPFTRGRVFDTMETDRGQYDAPARIFWATGAALVLRKSVLETVGGLDERFFMHMEEIDLCWRIQEAGFTVHAVPASVVYHIGGASLPQGDPRKAYYNFRNNLLLLYKHLSGPAWRAVFGRRVLLDGVAAARFLLGGSAREAWAVARAYADAHRLKRDFASDRQRDRATVPLPYRGSIVLDYFLRGRKTFAHLPPASFRSGFAPGTAVLEIDGQPDGTERHRHADEAPEAGPLVE